MTSAGYFKDDGKHADSNAGQTENVSMFPSSLLAFSLTWYVRQTDKTKKD